MNARQSTQGQVVPEDNIAHSGCRCKHSGQLDRNSIKYQCSAAPKKPIPGYASHEIGDDEQRFGLVYNSSHQYKTYPASNHAKVRERQQTYISANLETTGHFGGFNDELGQDSAMQPLPSHITHIYTTVAISQGSTSFNNLCPQIGTVKYS